MRSRKSIANVYRFYRKYRQRLVATQQTCAQAVIAYYAFVTGSIPAANVALKTSLEKLKDVASLYLALGLSANNISSWLVESLGLLALMPIPRIESKIALVSGGIVAV